LSMDVFLDRARCLSAGIRHSLRSQRVHRRRRGARYRRDPAKHGLVLMPPQATAVLATLLSAAPDGNRLELRLDHGEAELLCISERTFRLRRTLEGPLPKLDAVAGTPVPVEFADSPDGIRLRTRLIEVAIRKRGVLISVRALDGTPIMTDVSEA